MGERTADRSADRNAIVDALTRYAWALTDRDWDAFVDCFTPDGHVDYTKGHGIAGTPAEAAEWIAKTLGAFEIGISSISNIAIEFEPADEDAATARTLYTMFLKVAGDTPTYMEARGWYDDRLRRTDSTDSTDGTNNGWRLAERVETMIDLRG